MIGLVDAIAHDVYRIRFPGLLEVASLMSIGGLLGVLLVAWIGVAAEYVRRLDASLYSLLFAAVIVVFGCGGLVLFHR